MKPFCITGTIQDDGILADFATEFGSYCQFDLFGIENSYYQIKPSIDFFSDAQRLGLIEGLISNKFEDKILMSHDIHTKHKLGLVWWTWIKTQFGREFSKKCWQKTFLKNNLTMHQMMMMSWKSLVNPMSSRSRVQDSQK